MKRREDELIELAFGELDTKRAEELRGECGCNPQTQKVLADYEDMRTALRALKDIPEMQMSPERLRDAILKEGLKPHRAFNWNVLAWPAAACLVIAVGVVTMKRTHPVETTVVASSGQPSVSASMDFVNLNARPFMSEPKPKVEKKAVTPPVTTPAQPEYHAPGRRHRRDTDDLMAFNATRMEKDEPIPTMVESSPKTVAVSASPDKSTVDAPIVMIDPTPAPDTGADKAKEVAADNVVIGG